MLVLGETNNPVLYRISRPLFTERYGLFNVTIRLEMSTRAYDGVIFFSMASHALLISVAGRCS